MNAGYSIVESIRQQLAAKRYVLLTAHDLDATVVGVALLSGKPVVALVWNDQPLPARILRAVDHVIDMDALDIEEARAAIDALGD